jgi:large subunit ribosomal protein L6
VSRVGKRPIEIPDKVKLEISGDEVTVTGPKGTLSRRIRPEIKLEVNGNLLQVSRPSNSKLHRSLHGLTRQLVYNMVQGVSTGYQKVLEIVGVGYRAELLGRHVRLSLGFSHPCIVKAPEGITFELEGPSKIKVAGIDKELVGLVAAKIRGLRPPEPYKGKGVRYENEYVRRKAGKTGTK